MSKRLLVWLSLVFVSCAICWAGPYDELRLRAQKAKTVEDLQSIIKDGPETLRNYGTKWISKDSGPMVILKQRVESAIVASQALDEASQTKGKVTSAGAEAKKILSDPVFSDSGPRGPKNWLSGSMEKLTARLGEWLRNLFPKQAPGSDVVGGTTAAATVFTYGVIIILGLLLLGGLIWLITLVRLGPRKRKVRTGGMLEDDEPDRTADEWLKEADRLESLGEYRLACRCLYIASLVRIDEAGVARFERSETNWEHQARIAVSPRKPADLSFYEPTKRFDHVWYGYRCEYDDLTYYREFYLSTVSLLRREAA